jgi:hypothetical protein
MHDPTCLIPGCNAWHALLHGMLLFTFARTTLAESLGRITGFAATFQTSSLAACFILSHPVQSSNADLVPTPCGFLIWHCAMLSMPPNSGDSMQDNLMRQGQSWCSLTSALLRRASTVSSGHLAEVVAACTDKVSQGVDPGSAATSAGDLILEIGRLPELNEEMRSTLVATCERLPPGLKRASVLRNLHVEWLRPPRGLKA